MFRLHVEREVACSHVLNLHDGKCHNLHGHNYKIVVDVYTKGLINEEVSDDGMVMDFGHIKQIIDSIDHRHLNDYFEELITQAGSKEGSYLDFIRSCAVQPTSERLSKHLAYLIYNKAKLNLNRNSENKVNKITVKVYESSTNYAEYTLE